MDSPDAPYDPFSHPRSSSLPDWVQNARKQEIAGQGQTLGHDWRLTASDQTVADKANNRVVNPGLCEQLDRIEAKLDALIAASAAK